MDIAVFGDAHYAALWDRIDGILPLNPNRELAGLVRRLNSDTYIRSVISNGDSVDCRFSDYAGVQRCSNWDLFYAEIGKLEKGFFEIPGNHSYRKEPPNYSYVPLYMVGVTDEVRKAHPILKTDFRWFGELDSFRHFALEGYQGLECPQRLNIDGYDCIFLDSGGDALVRLSNAPRLLLKALLGGFRIYDGDGLREEQVEHVKNSIQGDGTHHIFMHHPLIHSYRHRTEEMRLDPKRFMASLVRAGLGQDVCLNGGGEVLAALLESPQNTVVIASHVHCPRYYLIGKEDSIAREVTLEQFNKAYHDAAFIKHATTLPLGAIYPPWGTHNGFMRLTPDGIEEVLLRDLA